MKAFLSLLLVSLSTFSLAQSTLVNIPKHLPTTKLTYNVATAALNSHLAHQISEGFSAYVPQHSSDQATEVKRQYISNNFPNDSTDYLNDMANILIKHSISVKRTDSLSYPQDTKSTQQEESNNQQCRSGDIIVSADLSKVPEK
ncbi:MAG: hypothetical protein AAF632_04475 [Bacteroidota bacterium]